VLIKSQNFYQAHQLLVDRRVLTNKKKESKNQMVFRRILGAPSSSFLFLERRMNNFFHFIAVRWAMFYLR